MYVLHPVAYKITQTHIARICNPVSILVLRHSVPNEFIAMKKIIQTITGAGVEQDN